MYQKIESEYNNYMSSRVKGIEITEFKKKLAKMIGTTTSNIYEIIKDGLITVRDYEYRDRIEFSATAAYNKRTKKSIESNASKRLSAKNFINLVIKEFRSSYNINSIDEIIHDLKLNRANEIEGMQTMSTSTFYNYAKDGKIEGFSRKKLPMIRKDRNNKKEGKTEPKGTSIEERPFVSEDRSEFGHWEGDTIVGSTNIKNSGAVFTLVERKTRFQITIKCENRKALTIYKAVKKIKRKHPELKDYNLKDIFKSITNSTIHLNVDKSL